MARRRRTRRKIPRKTLQQGKIPKMIRSLSVTASRPQKAAARGEKESEVDTAAAGAVAPISPAAPGEMRGGRPRVRSSPSIRSETSGDASWRRKKRGGAGTGRDVGGRRTG